MKKSEMISILKKEFPTWNDTVELDDYDFVGILSIIEKAGMIPPATEVLFRNGEKYIKELHQGSNTVTHWRWEPEDVNW